MKKAVLRIVLVAMLLLASGTAPVLADGVPVPVKPPSAPIPAPPTY